MEKKKRKRKEQKNQIKELVRMSSEDQIFLLNLLPAKGPEASINHKINGHTRLVCRLFFFQFSLQNQDLSISAIFLFIILLVPAEYYE